MALRIGIDVEDVLIPGLLFFNFEISKTFFQGHSLLEPATSGLLKRSRAGQWRHQRCEHGRLAGVLQEVLRVLWSVPTRARCPAPSDLVVILVLDPVLVRHGGDAAQQWAQYQQQYQQYYQQYQQVCFATQKSFLKNSKF